VANIFVRSNHGTIAAILVVALIGDGHREVLLSERDYVRFQPARADGASSWCAPATSSRPWLLGKSVGVYRRL